MTGTQALSQSSLGWKYFEQLGKQKVMQVQSSTEPPKKLAAGERSVMADGNEYNVFLLRESGVPIEPVYATEGTPLVVGNAAILKNAPNPNAAKLFYQFMFTREAQQLNSDVGGLRSFHPEVKEKAGRVPAVADQAADFRPVQAGRRGDQEEVRRVFRDLTCGPIPDALSAPEQCRLPCRTHRFPSPSRTSASTCSGPCSTHWPRCLPCWSCCRWPGSPTTRSSTRRASPRWPTSRRW
jgi:hypothetical protein